MPTRAAPSMPASSRRSASARSAAGYPNFDFRPVPLTQAVPALNDSTLVVCMIETVEGLANVDAIAAVDGVDVLHVGCNDLLTAMGLPGKFGCPEIVAAIERVIAAAKKHGKFAGLGGERDMERQLAFIKSGVRFVTTQTDIGFLMAAASQRTAEIRKGLGAMTHLVVMEGDGIGPEITAATLGVLQGRRQGVRAGAALHAGDHRARRRCAPTARR